jgi:hypothetical protein
MPSLPLQQQTTYDRAHTFATWLEGNRSMAAKAFLAVSCYAYAPASPIFVYHLKTALEGKQVLLMFAGRTPSLSLQMLPSPSTTKDYPPSPPCVDREVLIPSESNTPRQSLPSGRRDLNPVCLVLL